MKIAHVVWGFDTGGIETMLVNIINEQVNLAKVKLFIINDLYNQSLIDQISSKCKIIKCGRRAGHRQLLPIVKLNMQLLYFAPDIIHLHSVNLSKVICNKGKLVRTIHSTANISEEYPKMKALYAISKSVKDVTDRQGFPHCILIENGIPVSKIKSRNNRRCSDIFKIVQVGRLVTRIKGQHLLLQALSKIYIKGISNFEIHFWGDGESKEELIRLASDLGISKLVYFDGNQKQTTIYEHLCDYDLFVQPSTYEGFGLTVAEALAAKVPVLVSDIEGPMEVIDYGNVGMSFISGDVDDLSAKIESILNGEYDYNMIEKAYQRVKTKYDVAITAQKYIDDYKRLLKK